MYEVPMGLTLRELICGEQYCRGIAGGRALEGSGAFRTIGRIFAREVDGASGVAARAYD